MDGWRGQLGGMVISSGTLTAGADRVLSKARPVYAIVGPHAVLVVAGTRPVTRILGSRVDMGSAQGHVLTCPSIPLSRRQAHAAGPEALQTGQRLL